jgi:hypothetical protein
MGQVAVQDADQPVAQGPQRLMVAGTAGPVGVIAAPRTRGAGQRGECPQLAGIHQPLVTGRPGDHRGA